MSEDNNGNDSRPRKLMTMVMDKKARDAAAVNEQEMLKAALLATLEELGNLTHDTEDSLEFGGEKFILPEAYRHDPMAAAVFIRDYVRAQHKHYEFSTTYDYRPMDGAHAFQASMKKVFGNVGIGKNRPATFFTPEKPPEMRTINTSYSTTAQVPWGQVEFPMLDATFQLGATMDREKGMLFVLAVDAPKMYKKQLDAFFQVVRDELKKNSIYKGKAITGAELPTFLDLSKLDPSKVIYSDEVLQSLDTNLWSLLRHTALMEEFRIPLKRAVLLEGPYGTGKTMAGTLTAKEAAENGWTFILCRAADGDNLYDTLKTAQVYSPSVVWFEDIDKLATGGTVEEISKLLDALDGAQTKGNAVVAGFTTNHIDKIQKGVLRPGRLDAVIHIGELDAPGYEKLTRSLIPKTLLGDVDYDRVVAAMHGYMPAFVAEAINNSVRFAITRNNGRPDKINTDDIVDSALSLRNQWKLMNDAGEGANKPTLDSVTRTTLTELLNKMELPYDHSQDVQFMRFNADREPKKD